MGCRRRLWYEEFRERERDFLETNHIEALSWKAVAKNIRVLYR